MDKRINKCFIGGKYTDEINELNELGIETILLPSKNQLDDEINSHADILIFNCFLNLCSKKQPSKINNCN